MITFNPQKEAIITASNSKFNPKILELFKFPAHRLGNYIYYLKKEGRERAEEYAKATRIKEDNLECFLPQCDPWRDSDKCSIFCAYYDNIIGCRILYVNLFLEGEKSNYYED